MNERIKELAEQANTFARETVEYNRCDDFSEFTDRLYTVSREKFAELIVLECAEVSFKHWEKHKGCSAHFSIREHFGVE